MVDELDRIRQDLADAGGLRVLAALPITLVHLQSHHDILRADESPSVQVVANLNHLLSTRHINADLILEHALHRRITNKVPDRPEHAPLGTSHLVSADHLRLKLSLATAELVDLRHQVAHAAALAVPTSVEVQSIANHS